MAKLSPAARLGLAVAVGLFIADQATKLFFHYVIDLPELRQIRVLPIFSFTMVWNTGVSFGLFGSGLQFTRWLLVLFQLGVSAGVAVWLVRADRPLLGVGLGMVLGGALGNVIDRIIYGAVFDFLDFSGLWFPWVFNIADASISLGVVVLVYDSFFGTREETPRARQGGIESRGE